MIGIYILRFKNTDKVYVGQSINIQKRFVGHIYAMTKGTASKKLQEAYETYGLPELEIVCECEEEELNATEVEGIQIFNSVKNGFNMQNFAEGPNAVSGENCYKALHAKEDYIAVFKLLVNTDSTYNKISIDTGVSKAIIRSINTLQNHKWLKEEFPEDYAKLELKHANYIIGTRQTAKYRGTNYPTILSPSGEEYTVDILKDFCVEHGLNKSHLCNVLYGNRPTHKGWRLKESIKLKDINV